MIDNNMADANCLRCSIVETWDHVIKCKRTKDIRRSFLKELLADSIKNKPEEAEIDIIMSFIEDTLGYLKNEEEEDCKINQHLIGMQELFRVHAVEVWDEIDLGSRSAE